MRRPLSRLLVLLASLGAATTSVGCAGAHVEITATHSRYAISMSQTVRDSTGFLHNPRSLQKVGNFDTDRTRMGYLYSLLTILSHYDISDDVNAQVAAAGGEAVIGLRVLVSDGCDILNNFPFLNILPIWPGCVPVAVTGDIVKRRFIPGP